MAIAAYIFIETMQGKAKTIARQIGEIPGVKTAHTVTGPYDVITYVEADSLLTLGDFIVSKIQAISGVLRTLTNVIIDAPLRKHFPGERNFRRFNPRDPVKNRRKMVS